MENTDIMMDTKMNRDIGRELWNMEVERQVEDGENAKNKEQSIILLFFGIF